MIQIREDHMRFISELARYSNSEVGRPAWGSYWECRATSTTAIMGLRKN